MALIAMAVFDTVENQRSAFTRITVERMLDTVNLFSKHRLIIVDNNSCEETKSILRSFTRSDRDRDVSVITLEENIGTAEAINLAWKTRQPGENCIKMDNDCVVWNKTWVEELEEVIGREPKIGQVGLKRKDLAESPFAADPHFKSKLTMLPHKGGESWIVVEEASHIMGTCVMHSAALLDKIGYLNQPGVYGFDDSFASLRSKLNGFINCFLPHIKIDHIDTGENQYTQEKQKLAAEAWPEYQRIAKEYSTGQKSTYYNPFNK